MFLFRFLRWVLPGVVLVLMVWLIHDWFSPPWVNAGAVWVGGNLAVELERQSISITNEYARRLTIHQISPYRKLGSFPLAIDPGGYPRILLYQFTGPEGQPCLVVNDGADRVLDLHSGRVLENASAPSSASGLTYLGTWDGWKFCPVPILPEQGAKGRRQ